MKRVALFFLIGTFLILTLGQAQANMTIPNTFSSGNPAYAASVNENFTTVETAMPGVAQETINSFNLFLYTSTLETVISRSITAPTDGYVLAIASGMLYTDHTSGGGDSEGLIGISHNATTLASTMESYIQIVSGAGSGYWYIPFSIQGIFTVTQGTNTFYVLGRNNTNLVGWWDPKLSLLFVPNSYGTVTPLGSSIIPLGLGADVPGD